MLNHNGYHFVYMIVILIMVYFIYIYTLIYIYIYIQIQIQDSQAYQQQQYNCKYITIFIYKMSAIITQQQQQTVRLTNSKHTQNNNSSIYEYGYGYGYGWVHRWLWMWMIIIMYMPYECQGATVQMTSSSTDLTVGAVANVSLNIDRTKSVTGSSITPTSISTPKYQIIITFDNAYHLTNATLPNLSNYTLYPNNTIVLYYDTTLYSSNTITIKVANIANPYISSNYLSILVAINDQTGSPKDQAYGSLMYSFAVISLADVTWSFSPLNVSTIANMSINIKSAIFSASDGMTGQISFRRYWLRSLSNTTSTTIFSSTSSCSPTCTINRQTSATVVSFTNTSLSTAYNNSTKVLGLAINDIRTPPTLELGDLIEIVVRQSVMGSMVQKIDNLYVGGLAANSMQYVIASTTNTIAQPITLSISILSRNIFGPNDTVNIILGSGSQMLSTGPQNIYLDSALVSSYQKDVQDLNTLVLSSFSFYSTNYARLDGTLTLNRLVQASSTKPRSNNTIQLKRNGYIYNVGTFEYAVMVAVIANIEIAIDNNYANSNTSGSIKITLSNRIGRGNRIYIRVGQQISMYNCVGQCIGCSCSIALPTANVPYSQVVVSLDGLGVSQELGQLTVAISNRNPISQGVQLSVCTTDAQNYTKQCGNATYPNIVQASLSSDTLSVTSTSAQVYGIGNMSINYNFSTYDLQNGYIITILPPSLTLISPNNTLCRINGQPLCSVVANSSGTYINTSVQSYTKIYTIVIANVRNPSSTMPLLVLAKIAYVSGQIYYSVSSNYYSASIPYQLGINTHYNVTTSSCTNNAPNTITANFNNLPFSLYNQFAGVSYLVYNITHSKTLASIQQLYYLSTSVASVQYTHINWYSYEPITYLLTLLTADTLYQIWTFNITLQNCQPSPLLISGYEWTGLPQDMGTLMISYPNIYYSYIRSNSSNYNIVLTFPSEYPLTLLPTANTYKYTITPISYRVFDIKILTNQQPIIVQLENISNVININNSTNAPVTVQLFDGNYLIAQNSTYIVYRLSDVTGCRYPCKICASGDGVSTGSCLQCYSSAITNYYLLLSTYNTTTNTSIGRCVSATGCPTGTYPNATLKQCKHCPISCAVCVNQTYCSQCANYYYMLGSTCVTDCPQLYYPSTVNQTCVPCVHPCLSCVYADKCKSCASGYSLYTNTCVTVCPSGYIPILTTTNTSSTTSICYVCESPCQQCSQSVSQCVSCISGFYLTNASRCVSQCGSPLIGYQGVCASCINNCYRCVGQPSTCYACEGQYKLFNNTCIVDCPLGHYVSTLNGSSVCIKCSIECSACANASYCTVCASTYLLYNYYCYQTCPVSMYIHNTTITNATTSYIRQQCKPCSSSLCMSCPLQPSACVACTGGTYLYMHTCLQSCPTATYPLGTTCPSCSTGCVSCVDATQCTNCSVQYALLMGACVGVCPSDMVQLNNVCRYCSDYLLNCMNCTTLGCTVCASGYSLYTSANSSGLAGCVLQCPTGTIQQSISSISRCTPCAGGCTACTNTANNCTACASGYYYYNYTCVSACPSPMIAVNYQCKACTAPCSTCSHNNTSNCQSCIDNLFLLANLSSTNTCVSACPSNYYQELSNYKCVPCSQSCSGCVAEGCLACASAYFMVPKYNPNYNASLYDCVSVCPSHLQFVIPTNLCSACASHCVQCEPSTNYTCLQCEIGYIRYSQFCVLACPSPLVVKNGQCVQPSNDTTPNNTNNTNNTNSTPNATTTSASAAPVPFTIVSGVMLVLVAVSRVQYSWSSIPMGVLALTSILVPICHIVYIGTIWPTYVLQYIQVSATAQDIAQNSISQSYAYVRIALYLLISALVVIYLSNILHAIFGCATFRKDPLFQSYSAKHSIINKLIFLLALLTQHLSFVFYFSRLFNLSCFRASLKDLHCLSCLNYLWGVALVGNILGLVAGIIIAVKDSTLLLPAIDLIVVNCVVLIAGLMLLKKSKGSGWLQQDYLQQPGYQISQDDLSTKKVVMLHNQGDSDANIASIDVDTISEVNVNGKIKRKLIAQDKQQNEQPQKQQQNNEDDDQKAKDLLYFQQNNNKDQLQNVTDANKKDDQSKQSDSTDPLKIQPSINMLLTAQQMKPIHESHILMKEKGNQQDINDQSMGWSSLQKQNKNNVLPNQSILKRASPSRNIFDSDDNANSQEQQHKQISDQFYVDEGSGLQSGSPNKQKLSKQGGNSYASSKSLKATPRTNKQQIDESNIVSHNLAAADISKSRKVNKYNKAGGGRSSQQFASMPNKDSKKELSKSSLHKRSSSNSNSYQNKQQGQINGEKSPKRKSSPVKEDKTIMRTGSRASHRLSINSQPMDIIQQQNQQQQREKPRIVRGQQRFLSKVLAEDSKMENMPDVQDQSYFSQTYDNNKSSVNSHHQSPLHKLSISTQKNQHINKSPGKNKYCLSEIQKLASPSNTSKITQKNKKEKTQTQKFQDTANLSNIAQIKQENKKQQHANQNMNSIQKLGIGEQKQKEMVQDAKNETPQNEQILQQTQIQNQIKQEGLDPNAVKYRLQNMGKGKKIEGAHTIFAESDQQGNNKDDENRSDLKIRNYKFSRPRQYNTIDTSSNFPNSAGNLTRAEKLKALQHISQLRKSKIVQQQRNNKTHQTLNKRTLKSFRSRNVSADKLKLNFNQYPIQQGDGQFVKINTKALMKQIQRKQKIRSQKESLKNIYLKR